MNGLMDELMHKDGHSSAHPFIDSSPAIVLIRPQMGENIGAAARAMSNFGLSDLRIVAPRDGWPNEKATAMAAHGEQIVESAKLYATLPEALQGCTQVYATTATRRDMNKPVITPREAFSMNGLMREAFLINGLMDESMNKDGHASTHPLIHSSTHSSTHPFIHSSSTAILFGPERAGLTNEDLVYAHRIIEIPTAEENPSLNLAQAVCVVAYEYWLSSPLPLRERQAFSANEVNIKKAGEGCPSRSITPHPATSNPPSLKLRRGKTAQPSPSRGEGNPFADTPTLQGYFDQLEAALDARGYFREPHKKPLMWQHLRNIFVKAQLTEQEVRTLRGMVRALDY